MLVNTLGEARLCPTVEGVIVKRFVLGTLAALDPKLALSCVVAVLLVTGVVLVGALALALRGTAPGDRPAIIEALAKLFGP